MKKLYNFFAILLCIIVLSSCETGGEEGSTEGIAVTAVSIENSCSILIGKTKTLAVTVLPENATDKKVTWKSSNDAIAVVDGQGKVTALEEGDTNITAVSSEGVVSNVCVVSVVSEAVALDAISIEKTLSLEVNDSKTLTAVLIPENATDNNMKWKSHHEDIATVDSNGKVTAIKEGTADIIAIVEGVESNICTVTVVAAAIPLEALSIDPTLGLEINETKTLTAVLTPQNATNNNLTWVSSNPGVVTVNSSGKLTAIKEGTANVTVSAAGKTSNTCAVTVIKKDFAIDIPDPNFKIWLITHFDADNDGILTQTEALAAWNIQVSKKYIHTLEGIQYFTNITYLDCTDNQLTTIDLSKNTKLTNLTCYDNQLTTLDLSNNRELIYLYCGQNQLTTIDLSKNTELTYISCTSNQLTAIDLSKNKKLTNFSCNNNPLMTLDVSKNIVLEYLDCVNIQLTSMDVSKNPLLVSLNCDDNKITTLEFHNNKAFERLSCDNNQLTGDIDLSKNTEFETIYCTGNPNLKTVTLKRNQKVSVSKDNTTTVKYVD